MIPIPRRRSRLEMIWNIVLKDLRQWWKPIVITLIFAIIFMLITFNITRGVHRTYDSYRTVEWYWSLTALIYGVAALVTTLTVGLTFGAFYGGEIKKGTVRALILYPIDINDLTIAKLLSASIVGSLAGAIGFFLPLAPLVAYDYLTAGGVILCFLAALATTLFIVFSGAFLAHILAFLRGRLFVTPSVMAGIMLTLAALSTQTVLIAIGSLLLYVRGALGGGYPGWEDYRDLEVTADGISVVSPHHAAATVISGWLGPYNHVPDVYIALPLGIILMVVGFFVARRIYLDVFIR